MSVETASSTSTNLSVDPEGEKVVNLDHLMEYVNEMQNAGTELLTARDYKTSLQVLDQGIGAIAQCEGLPICRDDVPIIVMAKSKLYSTKGAVYRAQEL